MTTIPNSYASAAKTPTSKPAGSMGQTDFLKLMTTQLTTQDPFNPVDNTQMVAQMAQFSQVSGIAEMNASLKTLVANMSGGNRVGDTANWIGRSVLVASDVASAGADGHYAGEVALPDGADDLTISLVDSTGAAVHSEHVGAVGSGTVPFSWDGTDASGRQVPGPLKVVVNAKRAGDTLAPATATWALVKGIQSPAQGAAATLLTGLGSVSPDDALRLA